MIEGRRPPLFVGEVTAVQHVFGPAGERQVRVRAYDRLHRLRKRQSVRAYVEVGVHDLARELVAELGLRVEGLGPNLVWPWLVQHRPSDLELLQDVVEACGQYLALWEEDLYILTLEGVGVPIPLGLGRSLLEAQAEVNGEFACRSVTASGWNPLLVETYEGRAGDARVGRRVVAEASPARLGGSELRELLNVPAHDIRHAEALAQAELDRRAAHEVTLWGVAEGDPRLRAGAPIVVEGIADAFAGRYVVTAATHTIDLRRGFLSEFSTTPPPPRERETGAVVAPGLVTRVDDPRNLGRVRVSLPTYGDVESEWLHVLSPGAGAGKGLVTLPDVDDRVVVLFFHAVPGQAIVLGGLYGMEGPPDSGVDGHGVRRYTLRTPGGQQIQLDDARGVLRVENSDGSRVELTPQRVRVHAAADLELEAPGRSVVIRGRRIDFEEA
jgi:phage baseplate assembly protein gpV